MNATTGVRAGAGCIMDPDGGEETNDDDEHPRPRVGRPRDGPQRGWIMSTSTHVRAAGRGGMDPNG